MKKIITLVLALMLVFALAACGGGNDTPDPPAPSVSIVNASEEAWICSATKIAYVFLEGGNYESYSLDDGVWKTNGNGTYKLDAESLTLDSTAYSVKVEGDTITFSIKGKDYAYVKTSPFNPGQPSDGGLDEKLVLADGKAWVGEKNGLLSGYIFKADGTYTFHATDTWIVQSSGTWSTSGNSLTLEYQGENKYTYVINGDALTLTDFFGDTYGPYSAKAIPAGN